jgi:hypothetical protein
MEFLHVSDQSQQQPLISNGGTPSRIDDSFSEENDDDYNDDDDDDDDENDNHDELLFATTYSLSTDVLTVSWYECFSSTSATKPDPEMQSNIQPQEQYLEAQSPLSSVVTSKTEMDAADENDPHHDSRLDQCCCLNGNKQVRFSSSPPCVIEYEQPSIQWYGDLFYGPSEMQEFWNDAMQERQRQQQQATTTSTRSLEPVAWLTLRQC